MPSDVPCGGDAYLAHRPEDGLCIAAVVDQRAEDFAHDQARRHPEAPVSWLDSENEEHQIARCESCANSAANGGKCGGGVKE